LLAALPPAEWQRWQSQIEPVNLPLGQVLYEPGTTQSHVCFAPFKPLKPKSLRTAAVPPAFATPAAKAPTAPDTKMAQAKRDVDAGMVDTDVRATPGLDARRRAKLVPGPAGKPPATPGAEGA
jgi:hypothetical protein